jgi:glycosyltransferase involved in cell wall biosynthesis
MNVKSVFIVWTNLSPRAETMAAELKLDGQVGFLYEDRLKGRWLTPLRYLVQAWKTWLLLERERPEVVFVQSPPIFAPLVVAVWCQLRGKTGSSGQRAFYAIDSHTSTFNSRKWSWALPLLYLLSRGAAVTIVASEAAQEMLQNWKVRSLFLIDGLPVLSPDSNTIGSQGEWRVAVISSFYSDEPVAEVFAAARLMPQVTFYFSGNSERLAASMRAQKPENVILTGFLPDSAYASLLNHVQGLVVLTKEPNILNCGAYEAITMGKPAILSDWPQMRRYFTRGFVYVNNTPEAIAAGIKKLLSQQSLLIPEILAMRSELVAKRQPKFEELGAILGIGNPTQKQEPPSKIPV